MKHLLTHLLTFALTLVVLQAQTRTTSRFDPKAGAFGTRITVVTTPEMTADALKRTFFKFGNNKVVGCDPMKNRDNHTPTSCGWLFHGQHAKSITLPVPKGATSAIIGVTYSASGFPVYTDLDFEFKVIDVTSISPNPADKGDVLTITGVELPTGLSDPLPPGETLQKYIHARYTSSAGDYTALPPHCIGEEENINLNAEGTEATVTIPDCAISGKMGVYVYPFINGVVIEPSFAYPSPGPGFPSFDGIFYIFEFDLNLGVGDLTISSFSPTRARVGEVIQISGTGFSVTTEDNKVTFGNAEAVSASSWSKVGDVETLTLSLPADATTGKIKVEALGRDALSTTDFTRIDHTLTDFNPKSFFSGQEIINPSGSNVSFPIIEINEALTEIKARVTTEVIGVEARVKRLLLPKHECQPKPCPTNYEGDIPPSPGDWNNIYQNFTVKTHPELSVTSISPLHTTRVGEEVTAIGTGFSRYGPAHYLNFGNPGLALILVHNGKGSVSGDKVDARANDAGTELKFRVPPRDWANDIEPGKLSIFYRTQPENKRVITSEDFTFTRAIPTVTDFNPKTGKADTEITIDGRGFAALAEWNIVSFFYSADNISGALVAAHWVNEDGTQIKARVLDRGVARVENKVAVRIIGNKSAVPADRTIETPFVYDPNYDPNAPVPPVVSSFSPTEGGVDTEVTITGVNFSATPSANDVKFGGVMAAAPTSASTTSLTVLVPSGAVTGRVSVAVGGQTGTSSTDFTVTVPAAPVVLSFSPSEGGVDTEVTITGVNFSDVPSENELRFGGVMAAAPTSASTTSLVVLVPSGAVTGRVSVAVGGQTATSSTDFTVPGTTPAPALPVVSSFSPSEGEVDTEVTITGVNFSDVPSENELRFGGVMAAAPTSASTTSLTVLVPSGAVTGPVSVAVGGQTGTSSTDFTVTVPAPALPVVSSFSPSEGSVGTEVTITGVNFSATASENDVRFGGVMAAAPTSASTTSLTVRVPSGAVTGSISVTVGGQTATSKIVFTVPVRSISITNIRPVTAAVGNTITISGLGFSTTATENEVIFNGDATIVEDDVTTMAFEATDTFLKVKVPTGAKPGNISVRVNDQTAVSGQTFTVLAGIFSQPSLSEEIGVYPNPTSGELRFTNLSSTHAYVYKLYSIVGQQVARGVLKGDSIVKLEDAPLGQYILILRDEGRELMRTRLLVVR